MYTISKALKILDDSWSKDKSYYYIQASSVVVTRYPLADYDSFVLLKGGYAKYKYKVYYFGCYRYCRYYYI